MTERDRGEDTKCMMCNENLEDLNHFMLWCTGYAEVRKEEPLLQQPFIEDEENLVGHLLFEKGEEIKNILYKFWRIRDRKMKDL